jgi:predicted nucleic acid binding AN1-type Zn finger protein
MTTPFSPKNSPMLSSLSSEPVTKLALEVVVPNEKAKKTRCEHGDCRAKLGLLGFDCKCGAKFCGKHRYPDTHDCGYNYRAAAEDVLKKQLSSCVAEKLESRC